MAARAHLRRKFLSAKVAVSGANFAVAETGTLAVVESEGNGRMCLTLPETLITVMGIEKLVPTWADLEVFLQLLPRSSTGERMNPYTSMWTGVTPGDGPQEFHLVLLDNGRTAVLADAVGRGRRCAASAARPASTSARSTSAPAATPTARSTPDRSAPSSSPQLTGVEDNASLPYASSLCGACYDVCPVRIDIPTILVHLRGAGRRRPARRTGCRRRRRSRWPRRPGSMAIAERCRRGAARGPRSAGSSAAGAAGSARCRRRCPAGPAARDLPRAAERDVPRLVAHAPAATRR